MKLSKTQTIIANELYHYNSEVKFGVNIWYFSLLYYPYKLQTKGGIIYLGPEKIPFQTYSHKATVRNDHSVFSI